MKKIDPAKKLQLNTETVQTLTRGELEGVAGGVRAGTMSSADIICTMIPTCCARNG